MTSHMLSHMLSHMHHLHHLPHRAVSTPRGPAMSAYEEGDHFVVEAQLPGMKLEDIDVSLEQGVLTIRGDVPAEDGQQARTYLVRGPSVGRFSRSMRLSETVDQDAIEATYTDGVLRLTLAQAERAKARPIRIEAGDPQAITGARATKPRTKPRAKGSRKTATSGA
jgi:HSP20 family protein